MSGAGHVIDMNNRMRQNRTMKSSNRQKFQGSNRELDFAVKSTTAVRFKEVPQAELETIKSQIRTKGKSIQKRERILFVAVLVVSILALLYIYFSRLY